MLVACFISRFMTQNESQMLEIKKKKINAATSFENEGHQLKVIQDTGEAGREIKCRIKNPILMLIGCY